MKTIKIRSKVYELKAGDYIQDNNNGCLLFCAGDGRTLMASGYTLYSHVQITNKAAKELNYTSLPMKNVLGYGGVRIKRYYIQ